MLRLFGRDTKTYELTSDEKVTLIQLQEQKVNYSERLNIRMPLVGIDHQANLERFGILLEMKSIDRKITKLRKIQDKELAELLKQKFSYLGHEVNCVIDRLDLVESVELTETEDLVTITNNFMHANCDISSIKASIERFDGSEHHSVVLTFPLEKRDAFLLSLRNAKDLQPVQSTNSLC